MFPKITGLAYASAMSPLECSIFVMRDSFGKPFMSTTPVLIEWVPLPESVRQGHLGEHNPNQKHQHGMHTRPRKQGKDEAGTRAVLEEWHEALSNTINKENMK